MVTDARAPDDDLAEIYMVGLSQVRTQYCAQSIGEIRLGSARPINVDVILIRRREGRRRRGWYLNVVNFRLTSYRKFEHIVVLDQAVR